MRYVAELLILAIFALSGCSREQSEEGAKLADGTALACVNGQVISVEEVRKAYWYNVCYLESRSSALSGGRRGLESKIRKLKVELLSRVVNSALVVQEADRRGVNVNPEVVEREVKKTLRRLGGQKDFEKYYSPHGLDLDYLRKRVSDELRMQGVFRQVEETMERVSPVEATNFVKRVEEYNFNVDTTNRMVMARARQVFSSLSKDVDFAEAARKYSEFSPEDGEEWGEYNKGELPADLEKWAFSAPIGDLGGPYEVDDGIVIVKLLAREEGADQPSMAANKVATVSLARICFKALMREEEFSPQEAHDFLTRARVGETRESFVKSLVEKAKVTYPVGQVPWAKILKTTN